MDNKHGWSSLVVALLLLGAAGMATAADQAGTAWIFSGSRELTTRELDWHHVMHGHAPGKLCGSSCCESFAIAFPTNETFSLRHDGYETATGAVQSRRAGLVLVPDPPSVDRLL